jgi:hypothetical protein
LEKHFTKQNKSKFKEECSPKEEAVVTQLSIAVYPMMVLLAPIVRLLLVA